MQKTIDETQRTFPELAERMIQRYARGLLTVESLVAQLMESKISSEERVDWNAIEMQARGLCSRAVCEGCLAHEDWRRELAFENLGRYLAEVLKRSSMGGQCAGGQDSEVLQQTLLEIWSIFQRQGSGPDRPEALLGWARVILFRQLSRHLRQLQHAVWVSLETQPELVLDELVDDTEVDPLDTVLQGEVREELKEAILALKNPQYQQVLLGTFFAGFEERELAVRWQVQVQDIYLWRFRALKALRKCGTLAHLQV